MPRKAAARRWKPCGAARRACPRSTPPVRSLLFCHADHRLRATAALAHRGKSNAAPCRSGLRAALSRNRDRCAEGRARVAVPWLLTWIEGRRVVGRVALSKGGAVFKGSGVPEVGAIDRAPSHAAPAPTASAWYVSPSAPPALIHRLPATACGPPSG